MKKDLVSILILTAVLLSSIHIAATNNEVIIVHNNSIKKQNIKDNVKREYGIAIDSFLIIRETVKSKQSLSTILNTYSVSGETIHEIAIKSKGIFDLRKIITGKPYTIYCTKDSLQIPSYFVYNQTPEKYVLIDLTDSIQITRGKKKVTIKTKTASGVITSSLWNAVVNQGLSFNVAIQLSDVFAWSIDFFDLKKNDKFKLIYEEKYIDDVSIGIGDIKAAVFNHQGKDFYAIPFKQDTVETFFTEIGQSLKGSFLKAPLKYSRISSRFSKSRLHPILKIRRPHLGVDYAAPAGTPVFTIGAGIVTKASYSGGAGKMLKIKHNSSYVSGYLHLMKFASGIKNGTHVRQGQLIGYVGSTGLSTGPHLDFRIWKNGKNIDPSTAQGPPTESLKAEFIVPFLSVKNKIIKSLNQIKYPVETLIAKK